MASQGPLWPFFGGGYAFVAMEIHIPTALAAIAERLRDHGDGDRIAIESDARSVTWPEMISAADRFGGHLVARGLGMTRPSTPDVPWESPHRQVGLLMLNCPEYLEAMIGCWWARACAVNLNYRYGPSELAQVLNDCSAAALVLHRHFLPLVAQVLPLLDTVPELIVVDHVGSASVQEAPKAEPDLDALLEDAVAEWSQIVTSGPSTPRSVIDNWSADDRYVVYTGGTTGSPKGVLWRQHDFASGCLGIRSATLSELADRAANGRVRTLAAPPLMHGAAHWNALAALLGGGTVVIQAKVDTMDPADLWDTAARHRATALLMVGDAFGRPLLDELERRGPDGLEHLHHLVNGGAILSPGVSARLMELLDGVTVIDVLGASDAGRQAVATRHNRAATGDPTPASTTPGGFRPDAATVVLSEARDRVLDPSEHGVVGWLARSGATPLGYLGHEAATRSTYPTIDGVRYAVVGDRARWAASDVTGQPSVIELLGRDSVCINSGGEKIFAEEVEIAVRSHPAVFDAVVAGRPSERFGQEVTAIVALRPGHTLSLTETRDHVKARLAAFKAPRHLVLVDRVHRTPSGKADYRWAADQAQGG